jgi:hypothetical protein
VWLKIYLTPFYSNIRYSWSTYIPGLRWAFGAKETTDMILSCRLLFMLDNLPVIQKKPKERRKREIFSHIQFL